EEGEYTNAGPTVSNPTDLAKWYVMGKSETTTTRVMRSTNSVLSVTPPEISFPLATMEALSFTFDPNQGDGVVLVEACNHTDDACDPIGTTWDYSNYDAHMDGGIRLGIGSQSSSHSITVDRFFTTRHFADISAGYADEAACEQSVGRAPRPALARRP